MDVDGTLQVRQSRGVLLWTRCPETEPTVCLSYTCTDEIRRCVMRFNPVSDRIATMRLQCKPVITTVLQVYAPTSTAEEK